MQHVSAQNNVDKNMQQDEQNPRGAFISEREAQSHEQEMIREIAAQETQRAIGTHSCLPCPQVDGDGDEKNNACHYIDCLLCNTKTTRKNIHAFHNMQRAFFLLTVSVCRQYMIPSMQKNLSQILILFQNSIMNFNWYKKI
jgi:hypothetical protein